MDKLLDDWIEGRSDKTYVSRFDKISLGWEDSVLPSEGYSTQIYSFDKRSSAKSLIEKSYHYGKTRLDSMGIFDVPFRITDNQNCTDGKVVMVATEVFDNKELSAGARVDNFLGLVVHEAAHVLYTDFSFMKKIAKVPLKKMLWNIIEDEYIEREIGKEFPGYTNYLAAVKAEVFGGITTEAKASSSDDLTEIFNTVLLFIRYPKALDHELVKKHYELLSGIKLLFDRKYPESSRECVELAEVLYEILKEYYEKPPEEDKTEGEDGEPSEGSEKEEGSDDSESGKRDKIPNPLDALPESMGGKSEEEEEGEKALPDIDKDLDPELVNKILDTISSAMEDSSEKKAKTAASVKDIELTAIESRVDLEDNNVIIVPMTTGNMSAYMAIKNKVAPKIGVLANHLKFDTFRRTRVQKSLKHGKLDTGKLVAGMIGDDRIYTKKSSKKVKGGVFSMLIDESGSMGGGPESPMEIAKELAILFKEALKRTKLETYIYGHSADKYHTYYAEKTPKALSSVSGLPTFLNVYQERNKDIHQYAISNSRARSQNRDGLAILEAVKRVRKQTREHIYMLVLSDGAPFAGNYSGSSAVRDTRIKILEAERKYNATIIGIGIDVSYDMGSMYSQFVNFNNLDTFVQDVGKLIRGIIKKSF